MKGGTHSASALRRVWTLPALLAALIFFGLFAALLGTGIWRVLSWAALAVPLAVLCRHLWRGEGCG